MKHEHIHRDFIRKHLALLTSSEVDSRDFRDQFKRIQRAFYFDQYRNKFGTPSPKEMMEVLISHLRHTTPDDRIRELIDTLPFFKLTGENERRKLHSLLSSDSSKSALTSEEAQAIKNVGVFEAAKQGKIKAIEEAGKERSSQLQREIEAKKKELAELPSILDGEEAEEPDFNPEFEERKPWWERFGLRSDPFPRKDGLSAIDSTLYEDIIIKTEPFQRVLSLLNRNSNSLFSAGFLLVGDYGYGKTTFIDYLCHFLIHKEIIPLRITTAKAPADASGFVDSFLNKLRLQLAGEHKKILHRDPERDISMEIEDDIALICEEICKRRKGIVIFMDDYHKFKTHYRQIFEFLGTLQVLKDSLARNNSKVGFVVAGVPSWQVELKQNSQVLGFLDGEPIVLPEVTAELVCEVFNKRLEAFWHTATPRRIKPQFVANLVRDLGGEQGIRGCINRIVEELSNNNLAIVDSPVDVTEDTLQQVKARLERSPKVKEALNRLLYQTRFQRFSEAQIGKCLELLVTISVHNGIAEIDQQFRENQFHFRVLRDTGLIQKQRQLRDQGLGWNLSQPLQDIFRVIAKEYKLSPPDYLLKIYSLRAESSSGIISTEPVDSSLAKVKVFFAEHESRLDSATLEHINRGVQLLDRLLSRPTDSPPEERDVKAANEGLESITNGLILLDGSGTFFQRAGIVETKMIWELRPGQAPEIIFEAFDRLSDHKHEPSIRSRSHAVKTATDALKEIATILLRCGEEHLIEKDPLLHRQFAHTDSELNLLGKIQDGFYSTTNVDHFDYMKALVDYLELRFQSYFYFSASLTFGPDYFSRVPSAIRGYAHANIERRNAPVVYENHFDGLTRKQFREILAQGNELQKRCIQPLDLGWQQNDLSVFSSIFSIENLRVAHNQQKSYTPADKLHYRRFAARAEEILAAMNQMVSNSVSRSMFCFRADNGGDKELAPGAICSFRNIATDDFPVEGRCFVVNPEDKKSFKGIFRHQISARDADRVISALLSKINDAPDNILVQDLLDVDFIQTHYRLTLADFMCILAGACHHEKSLRISPWFGSSVLIQRGISRQKNN